jgi:hypothetical protein
MKAKIDQNDKEKAQARELKAEKKNNKKKFCDLMYIDTKSSFYVLFDIFLTITIVYSCLASTFFVCFEHKMSPLFEKIEWGVVFIFTVDIIFNVLIPFTDKDGRTITEHSEIFKNYASNIAPKGLLIDVLATFPFNAFFGNAAIFRLFRILRLGKLFGILNLRSF